MGILVHGWMRPLEILAYVGASGALAAAQLLTAWMAFGELSQFNQDFHFAFPATSQYTPRRLGWGRFFILSIPSDSGRTGRGRPCLFRERENLKSLPFQAISRTPLRPLPPSPGLVPLRRRTLAAFPERSAISVSTGHAFRSASCSAGSMASSDDGGSAHSQAWSFQPSATAFLVGM